MEEFEERVKKIIDEFIKIIEYLKEWCEEMRKELIDKEIIINMLCKE